MIQFLAEQELIEMQLVLPVKMSAGNVQRAITVRRVPPSTHLVTQDTTVQLVQRNKRVADQELTAQR